MDTWGLFLPIQAFLIAMSVLFTCTETTFDSEVRLRKLADEDDARAKLLLKLLEKQFDQISFLKMLFSSSSVAYTMLFLRQYGERFSDLYRAEIIGDIFHILLLLLGAFITLLLNQSIPKGIPARRAERVSLGAAHVIRITAMLFRPLTICSAWIYILCSWVFRWQAEENAEPDGEEEIRQLVDASSENGSIDHEEKEFIQNVFEFDDISVGEIATHRTDVIFLWMEEDMETWNRTIIDGKHTRYPVCDGTVDNVIGVLNAKEYFRMEGERTRQNVMAEAVKPAYFVPESLKADVLFRNMKHTRNACAIVLDEYGGMNGILTMYDLLEELVGKLGDEENIEEPDIQQLDAHTWKIHGSAALEDVSEALGVPLPSDDYDTFSGLIFGELGAVPPDGSQVELETAGLSIHVTEIKDHQAETAVVCHQRSAQEESV